MKLTEWYPSSALFEISSKSIDQDIAQFVDEEFFNLIDSPRGVTEESKGGE